MNLGPWGDLCDDPIRPSLESDIDIRGKEDAFHACVDERGEDGEAGTYAKSASN
jgi:hypothetical protein